MDQDQIEAIKALKEGRDMTAEQFRERWKDWTDRVNKDIRDYERKKAAENDDATKIIVGIAFLWMVACWFAHAIMASVNVLCGPTFTLSFPAVCLGGLVLFVLVSLVCVSVMVIQASRGK